MNPIAMTLLLVLTLGFFSWTAARRWRQLRIAAPEPRFALAGAEWIERLRDVLVYVLGQRKMPRNEKYRLAGLAHAMIFFGFMVLLLRSVMLWGRGYDADFDFWGLLGHGSPVGMLYGTAKDTFAVAVLVGAGIFVYLRVVKKEQRMTLSFEGLLILIIIIVMMLADILYDGANFALRSQLGAEPLTMSVEWAGSLAAFGLAGVSEPTLGILAQIGFWTHSALVLIFLNILPFSKHFHILTVVPKVFTRDRTPPGCLPKVEDLEGKVEREESLGINRLQDLTWSHVLDLYTCTECGRCTDNCPAYTTGKKLSPKHLTLALRDHLYDTERAMFGASDAVVKPGELPPPPASGEREEIHTFPRPPADAYFRAHEPAELIPNVLDPDVIWACTTCRACEEQCPVQISYVDKIVGMRRELVMMKAEFPPELTKPFQNLETNGNPWGLSPMDRGAWAEGLDVPLLADHPNAGVLLWVGCAASFDDRMKKIARATAKLLRRAEVDFAILGPEEVCTGDPARRAGNEYLFQAIAEQNIELLDGYGVAEKTVVTVCPHCFNTLANEYPDFGGRYHVVHHSEYLLGLVSRGKLEPRHKVAGKVAYHDSCYLGRYNDIYDSPRELLRSIPGVELVEVPYWTREKGLCCGAGGAQMFMEEQNTDRVNVKRTLQLLDTGADTLATGCPFCMTMITDGLKDQDKVEEIDQLDVAELLVLSVDFAESTSEAEAAE